MDNNQDPPPPPAPPVIHSAYRQRLLDKFVQAGTSELLRRPEEDDDDIKTPEVMPLPGITFPNWITVGNLRSEIRRVVTDHTAPIHLPFITREQAAVHAVQQWCEIAELWPEEWILEDTSLTVGTDSANPIEFLVSFHRWFAARLIFNAAMGPTYAVRSGQCHLQDIQKISQELYNGLVLPLVQLFVLKLNPQGLLSVKALLDSNMEHQQKNIYQKVAKNGIWSDEGILYLASSNPPVPLRPKHIRGVWFPFLLAADRLIKRSQTTICPNATNSSTGKHYITANQKAPAVFEENASRRNFQPVYVPSLPEDADELPNPK